MLGYFPTPYPDELLYSIIARLRHYLQFPSEKTFLRELFGTTNIIAVTDLPGHLEAMLSHLPRGHDYTVNQVIDEHTLLPYYKPFLSPERLALVQADMRSDKATGIHMRLGVMASSIRKVEYLRLCLQCQSDDIAHWGEPYWHRSHQLPGMVVCPTHNIGLVQTNVRCTNTRTRYLYISAHTMTETIAIAVPAECHAQMSLLQAIAHESAWLLKGSIPSFRPEQLRKRYKSLLEKHGYATRTGRLHAAKLLRAFRDRYGDAVLAWWGCTLHEQQYEPWLLRLVRDLENVHHPLKHLLLLNFLGESVSDFFASLSQQTVEEPERSEDVTAASMQPSKSTFSPEDQEANRAAWQELCAQHPNEGVKDLRRRAGGLYMKLYRNDRQWLQANRPARRSRGQAQRRINWAERDRQLANQIPQAAATIHAPPDRPRRVTKTELGKVIGAVALLQQHIDKLPKTEAAIAQVVESREAYAVRRVQWAARQYRMEMRSPKQWELIRRAGVERLTHHNDVKAAIDAQITKCIHEREMCNDFGTN